MSSYTRIGWFTMYDPSFRLWEVRISQKVHVLYSTLRSWVRAIREQLRQHTSEKNKKCICAHNPDSLYIFYELEKEMLVSHAWRFTLEKLILRNTYLVSPQTQEWHLLAIVQRDTGRRLRGHSQQRRSEQKTVKPAFSRHDSQQRTRIDCNGRFFDQAWTTCTLVKAASEVLTVLITGLHTSQLLMNWWTDNLNEATRHDTEIASHGRAGAYTVHVILVTDDPHTGQDSIIDAHAMQPLSCHLWTLASGATAHRVSYNVQNGLPSKIRR